MCKLKALFYLKCKNFMQISGVFKLVDKLQHKYFIGFT